MKKTLLLLFTVLMSLGASAQNFTAKWEMPAPPEFSSFVAEDTLYLWNVNLGGFFVNHQGGTERPYYGTAASINDSIGAKVIFTRTNPDANAAEEEKSEIWPNAKSNTYLLVNYVSKFKEFRCAFTDGWMWTDNNTNARRFFDVDVVENGYIRFTGNYSLISIADPTITEDKDIWTNHPMGVNADRIVNISSETIGNTEWACVSQANYDKYMETMDAKKEQIARFTAASNLRMAIENAAKEYPTLDFSAPTAVYNNTSSTLEELVQAKEDVAKIILAYTDNELTSATPSNPVDATAKIVNPSFEDGTTGWTYSKTNANGFGDSDDAQAADNGNGTYHCDNADGNKLFNIWAWGNPITQKIENLPNGIYKLEAMVASSDDCTNVYITAEVAVGKLHHAIELEANPDNGSKQSWGTRGSMIVPVTDGTITIGAVGCDADGISYLEGGRWWYKVDDFRLTCLGNTAESWKYFQENGEISFPEFDDETVATAQLLADYNQAREDFMSKTSADEIIYALEGMVVLSDSIKKNIEDYKTLDAKLTEWTEKREEKSDLVGDAWADFCDFMDGEEVDGYPAQSPAVALEEHTMTSAEIEEYIEEVDRLFSEAVKSSLEPGSDCTDMLKNPAFTAADGNPWVWNKNDNVTALNKRGGLAEFYCAEAYGGWDKNAGFLFDVYQDVANVPDGLYSISANCFYRPADNGQFDGTEDVPAVIYMNDFQSPVQHIAKDAKESIEGEEACGKALSAESWVETSGVGFVPNSMNAASQAFALDMYKQEVYGLVEGGKMRIGIKKTITTDVNRAWCLWTNFKLTYEGKTVEALTKALPQATDLLFNYLEENADYVTDPVVKSSNEIVKNADDAVKNEDVEEMYDALIAVNKATVAARENVAAVKDLIKAVEAADAAANEEDASEAGVDQYNNLMPRLDESAIAKLTTEEVVALKAEVEAVIKAINTPDFAKASDANPVNVTKLVVNPDFQQNAAKQQATGWTLVKLEGAEGNYQTQDGFTGTEVANNISMEFWSNSDGGKTKYNFYQIVKELPAGTYVVSADASNSLNGQEAGPGEGAAYIYAGAAKDDVVVRYAGSDPIKVQTEGCKDAFENYSAIITLNEGEDLVIGSTISDALSARWVMIDNFKVMYCGTSSTKQDSPAEPVVIESAQSIVAPVAIYTTSGARVSSFQKGVNIVKMSDGSIKKVLK